jgi:hypothetical protein
MSSSLVIPLVLQIAVPLAFLGWQAAGRDRNIAAWGLKHIAAWTYIYATSVAGLWLVVPWYIPHLLIVLSISLAARTLPAAFRLWHPPGDRRRWLSLAARASVAVMSVGTLWVAAEGRSHRGGAPVDLTFPLRSGHYYIANGGSTELVNAHLKLLTSDRFRRFRGAAHGVDIVALDRLGNRATGIAPRDPAQYAIFGDAIYAPCEGVVVRVEDWLPDLAPPEADRAHMAGNFVMLECGESGEFHVLLAHMRSGSVKVHPGAYVTTDTRIGEVGNSGNSDEPHLHVHAQRPGHVWDVFNGDPLPVTFSGRYLARNDRLSVFEPVEIIDD